jgi:hypothetical protein
MPVLSPASASSERDGKRKSDYEALHLGADGLELAGRDDEL